MPIKFIGSKLFCRFFVVCVNDVLMVLNKAAVLGFLNTNRQIATHV